MTDRPTIDEALVAWLHRGSQAAPSELLGDVVEQVSHTRQDQSLIARIWSGGPAAGLVPRAVVVAAALGLLAIGVAVLQPRPAVGPAAPVNSPTPAATVSPSAQEPSAVRVSFFDRPFTYRLDPDWGLTTNAVANAYQFRTRNPADEGHYLTGVNVRAYPNVKADDWCNADGRLVTLPSPQQIVDAIVDMPGLDVSDVSHTTIDGKDALVVTVTFHTAAACPDIYLFSGSVAFNGGTSDGQVRRMALFDVDGETISVATVAEQGAAAASAFYPTADAFIETLHFEAPEPSIRASP